MREFMTKVSDYLSEWREDPEREEGQFPRIFIAGIGIVAVVAIVLLLWWGHGVQERGCTKGAGTAGSAGHTGRAECACLAGGTGACGDDL